MPKTKRGGSGIYRRTRVHNSTCIAKMLVQTNYDAMSCYNRIIPNMAMMVSRKYGVPKVTTQSNARTLEVAEYRIQMPELGVSATCYTH